MEKQDIKRIKKQCEKCKAFMIKFTDKKVKGGEKPKGVKVCVFCEPGYKEKIEVVRTQH